MKTEHAIIAAGTVLSLLLAAAGSRDAPAPHDGTNDVLRVEDAQNPLPPADVALPALGRPGA